MNKMGGNLNLYAISLRFLEESSFLQRLQKCGETRFSIVIKK